MMLRSESRSAALRLLSLPRGAVAWGVVAAVAVGCAKDKDGSSDTDTDTSGDSDDTADSTPQDVDLRFRVRGVGTDGFSDLAGATCEWTQRSGESFQQPVTDVTDAEGFCTLTVPEDRSTVTVRVSLADHVDVLAAGFPTRPFDASAPENSTTGIVMFTEDQADQTYEAFQLTRDTSKGYVTAVATWLPSGQGALQPIGCVEIDASAASPEIEVYLGGIPNTPSERDTTDPQLGTWMAFDITPGSYAFEATIEGGASRTVTVPVLANTFTNIPLFFQAASNPTPSNCD